MLAHLKSLRANTNTDVRSNAADVEICDFFLSDQFLHVGGAQFLVVKKGRVGINVGVETLLDYVALRVHLGTKVVRSTQILYLPSDLCEAQHPKTPETMLLSKTNVFDETLYCPT